MPPTVSDLVLVLQLFLPAGLSIEGAFYLIGVIISSYPLLRLHINQRRQPHQPARTAWTKTILTLLKAAFKSDSDEDDLVWATGMDFTPDDFAQRICDDLEPLYNMLGLNPQNLAAQSPGLLFPTPRRILCTSRLSCAFCPVADLNIIPTLRRRVDNQTVWILDESFCWVQADLVIAHCATCRADYFPDRITYKDANGRRRQKLELSTDFLRISKHGIWAHKKIALFQEHAVHRLHAGWSNLAELINDFTGTQRKLTYRQSQRLFVEHFSRRLLHFHKRDNFSCDAQPSTKLLAEAVRREIGVNGGFLESAMAHGCTNCTHLKRYRSDLAAEGANFGDAQGVAGVEADGGSNANAPDVGENPFDPPAQQDAPPAGQPRGYVRLAVMDGKNIPHQKCALDQCERPLVNYKNGRFCEVHLNLQNVCGIVPCGLPVRSPGALTCATESHIQWHRDYSSRFARLSFPGVRRVIRRQQEHSGSSEQHGPTLEVALPPLGDTPGNQVVHTFKAKSTYCLQTVQWACGYPVGWGKCYRSESSSQVLGILNRIWANFPNFKPSFVAYDDACNLLRHIITQNPNDPWILTTKFIVDAWHYINHRATDILCRLWCNPAPKNGSQPDLVLVEEDSNGIQHETRAFNTETAEQLNSWLSGFESQLRHMSDVNYDFYVHVLLMIYAERVDKHVAGKALQLTAEFWAEATGE
ncbi:hypothetical protein R3P38DRAFT_2655422 [Favolaschia claudopus]|uniref:CxC5 like cysteine cluster associated with KDZ domain-containing protein n=1 Tax=Favolaschia claudopus TaxID=2862362 RepID=A0AAV9ZY20_9AGAR